MNRPLIPAVRTTPTADPERRRHLRGLAATAVGLGGFGVAGCGGSGGGGGGENNANGDTATGGDGRSSRSPFETPNPADGTATGNVPPATGSFGGGQGKILLVEGGDRPKAVIQVDLASRQLQTITTIQGSTSRFIGGGVSRASDGSFVIIDYEVVGPTSKIYHHGPDGSLLKTIDSGQSLLNGGTVSPDASQVAYIRSVYVRVSNSFPFYENQVWVFLVDLRTGEKTSRVLISHEEPTAFDKAAIGISYWTTVYMPDGQLYALLPTGLYRIDRSTAVSTRLFQPDIGIPAQGVASPDGRSIYFVQGRGNPYGGTIWSIDIASGALTRRSIRSQSGEQFAPGFSPDGNWMMLQETSLTYLGIAVASYYWLCAIRNAPEPIDSQNLRTAVFGSDGKGFTASGRMAWF